MPSPSFHQCSPHFHRSPGSPPTCCSNTTKCIWSFMRLSPYNAHILRTCKRHAELQHTGENLFGRVWSWSSLMRSRWGAVALIKWSRVQICSLLKGCSYTWASLWVRGKSVRNNCVPTLLQLDWTIFFFLHLFYAKLKRTNVHSSLKLPGIQFKILKQNIILSQHSCFESVFITMYLPL